MPDAIKPTSVEGYLIRLYDKVESLDNRMSGMEGRLNDLVASERAFKEACDGRIKEVESRVTKGESHNLGVKELKSSLTPYIIAFLSCLLTILSYIALHMVGIK
jgi:hypothetical protein